MAKKIPISVKIMVDGKEQIVTASTTMRGLRDAMASARGAQSQLNKEMLNMQAVTQVMHNVGSAAQNVSSMLKGLTDAYNIQLEAETKLSTVMRERMNASDAEIQSIKDLTQAQQQMGIIGDEVQMAGAQQLATFLKEKSALDTLIPAMNNLVAQQRGFNASSSDAVSVGNMMGKVMQGQTSALKRVGISFTEAQEQMLKYGDEEMKAATLAQVITDNVGQMNRELANTPSGQVKQMSNAISDMAEQAGKLILPYQPMVQMAANATMATTGVMSLASALGKLAPVSKLSAVASTLTTGAMKLLGFQAGVGTVQLGALTVSARVATVAIRGLMIATGVGAAIVGLSVVVGALTDKLMDNTNAAKADGDAMGGMTSSLDTYAGAAARAQQTMDDEISKLKQLIKNHGDTSAAIEHLNTTYGSLFGRHSTAAQWYDILTQKSKDYVRQLGYEAVAQEYGAKTAEAQIKVQQLNSQINAMYANGTATTQKKWMNGKTTYEDTPEVKALKQQRNALLKEFNNYKGVRDKAVANLKNIDLGGGTSTPATPSAPSTPSGSTRTTKADKPVVGLQNEWEEKIRLKREEVSMQLDDESTARVQKELDEMLERYAEWKLKVGIDKEDIPDLKGEVEEIEEPATFNANATKLKDIKTNIDILRGSLDEATADTASGINQQIKYWEDLADKIENAGEVMENTTSIRDNVMDGWGEIKSIGGGIEGMTSALEGNQDAWSTITGVVDGALQIWSGIEGIISLIQMLTQANEVATGVETAKAAASLLSGTASVTAAGESAAAATAELPIIATNRQLTTSYMELAAAEYMAAHAAIPFIGVALGTAATQAANAVVLAQQAIPFADGGVISGPTFALVGEYAGAQNNPEVIAPLDKLKSYIGDGGGMGGNVEFRIKGDTLYGVLANTKKVRGKKY